MNTISTSEYKADELEILIYQAICKRRSIVKLIKNLTDDNFELEVNVSAGLGLVSKLHEQLSLTTKECENLSLLMVEKQKNLIKTSITHRI